MSTTRLKVMVPPAVVAPRAAQLVAMLATPLFQALAWLGRSTWASPPRRPTPAVNTRSQQG